MSLYKVSVEFLVYADNRDHAFDQIRASLDSCEEINDRYEIIKVTE